MRIPLSAIVTFAMMVLAGCGDTIRPTTKHDAIAPDDVRLLQQPPGVYERMGMLRVPVGGAVKWDMNADANAGFEQFMAQAGARGANAVIFKVPDNESDTQVTAGYKGVFYVVPIKTTGTKREAVAQAIFIHDE
jgi:hypothetical protein